VDDSTVNAFAAPGGYIVVYRGLLRQAETPEELAGVLAHELQHVLQRHGTKAVLQEIPLRLVVAAATGDAGITGRVLGTAATLGALRYRRRDESAADRAGMEMLRAAQIDPDGMIRFFSRLVEQGDDIPALVAYLSTHPRNRARIEALQRLAAELNDQPVVPLDNPQWNRLGAACVAPPQ
jgi:predicted Zn-dependent protease